MENHIEIEAEKQDKGFTLVELLIVIVILGILATVTVFAVTGITNKGKTSACQADQKTLQTAEEAFSANTGAYGSQAELKTAGLLHDVSTNFTVTPIAAVVAGNGPDGLPGTADDVIAALPKYTMVGASTNCTPALYPLS
jgi:prepilin-type N-terminal cleavage/methylation domain-containing protein